MSAARQDAHASSRPPCSRIPARRDRTSRRLAWLCTLALLALSSFTSIARAHGGEPGGTDVGPQDWHELARAWAWEPVSWIALIVSLAWYAVGLTRLWRAAGVGHGVPRWEALCFLGGWLTLFVALVSPLHPWGSVLFSVHMTQHELLMLVAAPLLVLARPMPAMLHALPHGLAGDLGRLSNVPAWRLTWRAITNPFVAWLLHAVVLWGWHAPALFQATQRSEWVHAAQHAAFLGSALLFWWSLIHAGRGASAYGAGVLYLFTTALHSGLLGALLTFARTLWYPIYADRTGAWGLTPLQDQALGGLIMWVPACAIYIVAGLALFAGWLRESERRAVAREERSMTPKERPMAPIPEAPHVA